MDASGVTTTAGVAGFRRTDFPTAPRGEAAACGNFHTDVSSLRPCLPSSTPGAKLEMLGVLHVLCPGCGPVWGQPSHTLWVLTSAGETSQAASFARGSGLERHPTAPVTEP